MIVFDKLRWKNKNHTYGMKNAFHKHENIIPLLSDNTKSDQEVADLLGYSKGYLAVLRKRLGIKKSRGTKAGTKLTAIDKVCPICDCLFSTTPSTNKTYCSRECMWKCSHYRHKLKTADKSYMQTDAYKSTRMKAHTDEYRRYANRVHKLSEQTYQNNIDVINPNGYIRGLAGVAGAYHLDHKVSIKHGFSVGMSEEHLSSVNNLQMIPWHENVTKGG